MWLKSEWWDFKLLQQLNDDSKQISSNFVCLGTSQVMTESFLASNGDSERLLTGNGGEEKQGKESTSLRVEEHCIELIPQKGWSWWVDEGSHGISAQLIVSSTAKVTKSMAKANRGTALFALDNEPVFAFDNESVLEYPARGWSADPAATTATHIKPLRECASSDGHVKEELLDVLYPKGGWPTGLVGSEEKPNDEPEQGSISVVKSGPRVGEMDPRGESCDKELETQTTWQDKNGLHTAQEKVGVRKKPPRDAQSEDLLLDYPMGWSTDASCGDTCGDHQHVSFQSDSSTEKIGEKSPLFMRPCLAGLNPTVQTPHRNAQNSLDHGTPLFAEVFNYSAVKVQQAEREATVVPDNKAGTLEGLEIPGVGFFQTFAVANHELIPPPTGDQLRDAIAGLNQDSLKEIAALVKMRYNCVSSSPSVLFRDRHETAPPSPIYAIDAAAQLDPQLKAWLRPCACGGHIASAK